MSATAVTPRRVLSMSGGWLPLAFALLSLLALSPGSLAKNYERVPAESIFDTKEKRYGHLEHVGFYASAMNHWNFTSELAPFTNLTWISTGNADNIIRRIKEAEDAGVKVVLDVQPLVFDADYQVRSDYLYRLADIRQRIVYAGLTDQILMVYTIDEPYFRASRSTTTNKSQMYEAVGRVNGEIKELFPGVPLGVIFSRKEIYRDDFRIPEFYDWVGFNCYASMYNCDRKPMTAYYGKLLKHMSPDQSLMAVPEAWISYSDYQRRKNEPERAYQNRKKIMADRLEIRLKHHYEIALSEPRFIAFIPFLWSMEAAPGKPAQKGFGVDRFEEMFPDGGEAFVDLLSRIGTEIKTGSHVYPSLRLKETEKHLLRPKDRYRGQILEVSQNGRVSAWAINRALPHKSLRVNLVVHESGNEVYSSNLKRTFIVDNYLSFVELISVPAIGIHGYRHTLPKGLMASLRGKEVEIELRIYGDRAPLANNHSVRSKVVL